MRILVVSPRLPWPPDHGGRIRGWQLLSGLLGRHEVRLAAGLSRSDRPADVLELKARGVDLATAIVPAPGHRLTLADRISKYLELARGRSSLPARFHSAAMASLVRNAVAAFRPDGAVLDQSFAGVYAEALDGVPYLLSTYNVESAAIRARAQTMKPGPAAAITRLEGRRLARFEARVLRGARRAVACSPGDAAALRQMAPQVPVDIVENGVDLSAMPLLAPPEPGPAVLAYVGSYDYQPNREAARELVREVWPLVRQQAPGTELLLIGGGAETLPGDARDQPGLRLTGRVEDMAEALLPVSALVLPIRYGGGSRLKILEALAAGRPVVTTSAGAEGLAIEPESHYLRGETPGQLAGQVLRLLGDPDLAARLIRAGRSFVASRHDWSRLRERFRESVERAFSSP